MESWKKFALGSMLFVAVACGGGGGDGASQGKYMTGEIHNHTGQSNDIQTKTMSLENIFGVAFRNLDIINAADGADAATHMYARNIQHGKAFDYLFFADHLRNTYDSADGLGKYNGNVYDTPLYIALETQFEAIKDLQAANPAYRDKILWTGFEWDAPMLDHAAVGIIAKNSDDVPYEAIHEFEWLYAREHEENYNRNSTTLLDIWGINDCDADSTNDTEDSYEYQMWGRRQQPDASPDNGNLCKAFPDEQVATVATTYAGIAWLEANNPDDNYILINHPSRKLGVTGNPESNGITIENIRRMHDAGPSVLLGMEGLIGGVLDGRNAAMPAGSVRGRADEMIAITGGVWDSLLSEGRRIHNFSNSDFHFKVNGESSDKNSSAYWPSEYSRDYVYVTPGEGANFRDVVAGMKSGNSYAVLGELISDLEFTLSANGENAAMSATMGEELSVTKGDKVTVTIRFKIPENNNYAVLFDGRTPINQAQADAVSNKPELDHIDLISGTVTGKVDEADYNKVKSDAKIVASFTAYDWGKPDADGFYTINYEMPENTTFLDRFIRIRGLNSPDVDGFGDPAIDERAVTGTNDSNNMDEGNEINDFNYTHLSFYANPIWLTVR